MRTIKKQAVSSVYFPEFLPSNETFEDNKIYISVMYKIASHKCLCGCGNISVTPIKDGEWRIVESNNGGLSMKPSILNKNCPNKSHYIITNGIANFV